VCHQSSSLTIDALAQRILRLMPKGVRAQLQQQQQQSHPQLGLSNKRAMCDVYEVLLRRHAPDAIVRTHDAK
jgi:hypothetical protein